MTAARHLFLAAVLTALSLFGGLAWLAATLATRPGWRRAATALVLYAVLTAAAVWTAPLAGRQVTGCWGRGEVAAPSPVYCLLNRSYVTADLAAVLDDLGTEMAARHPDLAVHSLDGSFPFTNLPLLPHLSHDDGKKMDLALFYRDRTGATDRLRSPLGYFAFEDGPTDCPDRWLTLRWSVGWLQPLWPDLSLDADRTAEAVRRLAADPRVGKILFEPHLQTRLGIEDPKVRFQGCRAARHDDHLHLQL